MVPCGSRHADGGIAKLVHMALLRLVYETSSATTIGGTPAALVISFQCASMSEKSTDSMKYSSTPR